MPTCAFNARYLFTCAIPFKCYLVTRLLGQSFAAQTVAWQDMFKLGLTQLFHRAARVCAATARRLLRPSAIALLWLVAQSGLHHNALATSPEAAARAAFPTAYGYGARARQWHKAKIVFVDRLSDSNPSIPGELRYALNEITGPRIIIFRIGGTIRATRTFFIEAKDSDVYIAGQTAPGGGITIRGNSIRFGKDLIRIVKARNVIIRFLRLRLGKGPEPGTGDNLSIVGSSNIMLDHLSLSWSNDENLGIFNPKDGRIQNLTVQNNLLAEPLAPHSTNFLITTEPDFTNRRNPLARLDQIKNISIHRNVFTHATHRAPMVAATRAMIANNLTYNWEYFALGTNGNSSVDYVNNILVEGPLSRSEKFNVFAHQTFVFDPLDPPQDRYDVRDPKVFYMPLASIYNHGNYRDYFSPDHEDGIFDAWPEYVERIGLSNQLYACDGTDWRCLKNNRRRTPLSDRSARPYPIARASQALSNELVARAGASRRLTCAGNWYVNRDRVDKRIINELRRRISHRTTTPSPTSPAVVGGYDRIRRGVACADADNDGMPDKFELRYGLNASRNNALEDVDRDGYRNIEEYLNATDPTVPDRDN